MLIKETYHIDSCLEEVTKIESIVNQLQEKHDLKESVYGNILLCLTEAVNNAIIHGNNLQKTCKVQICVEVDKENVCFQIKDEGCGFDIESIPDPTAPENIKNCGGRGVFLMKQLADKIIINKDAACIQLTFIR